MRRRPTPMAPKETMTTLWPFFLSLTVVSTIRVKTGSSGSCVCSSTMELVPVGRGGQRQQQRRSTTASRGSRPSLMTMVRGLGRFIVEAFEASAQRQRARMHPTCLGPRQHGPRPPSRREALVRPCPAEARNEHSRHGRLVVRPEPDVGARLSDGNLGAASNSRPRIC